jgi:PST family polysaccharide transporter/lipopolysaccharide exporter
LSEKGEMTGGLTGPVVRGGRWLFLSQIAVNGMMMARSFILMPLLRREDWGLWAAIATTLMLLKNLSETGVNMVAVQHRQGDSPEVLMTAWWLNVVRGLLLAGLMVLLAPVLAGFFREPALTHLFRLVSFVFLMDGLVSTGIITATRNLAFNRLVLVQQGSTLVSVVSALVLGVVFRNVLALVVAELVRVVLLLVLSYVVLPVRPSFAVSLRCVGGIWRMIKDLYLAQMFQFLLFQGDVFVVGRLCDTAQLGLYRLAFAFGTASSAFITSVVERVVFPAFARIRDDAGRLRQAFLRVQRFVAIVAVPSCLVIVALAPAVAAFGGQDYTRPDAPLKYAGLVFPMQMFALGVYLTCLVSVNSSVFLGLGLPVVIRKVKALHLLLVAAAIYPLTKHFGINGTVMITFLQVPAWLAAARFSRKHIDCGVRDQLANQLFIVVPAAAMGLTTGALWLLVGTRIVVYTVSVCLLSPAVYLGLLRLTAPASTREFMLVVRQALGQAPRGEEVLRGFAEREKTP